MHARIKGVCSAASSCIMIHALCFSQEECIVIVSGYEETLTTKSNTLMSYNHITMSPYYQDMLQICLEKTAGFFKNIFMIFII